MKKIIQKWIPPLLMALMAVWYLGGMQTPVDKDFAFQDFGRLPVTANGRIIPMDTLARNSLLQIREKQTANLEPWKAWNQSPKIISATEWLANVMMNPSVADTWPVFRVDHPDLVSLLKLPDKDAAKHQDGKNYSWNQLSASFDAFNPEAERCEKIDAPTRTAYERAVIKLAEQRILYTGLKNALEPEDATNWPGELARYESIMPAGIAAVRAQQAGEKFDSAIFDEFARDLQHFDYMSEVTPPLVLPPSGPESEWHKMGVALLDTARGAPVDQRVIYYASLTGSLAANNPESFNKAIKDLFSSLTPQYSRETAKARAEQFFNQMEPFYHALVIYVLAGMLAFFFWFNLSETLRRSSVWLIGLGLLIHTAGLLYRMILEGRPPVTNLYSSAIFIGWGAVILGLVLEFFHRNGIGAVVSSGMGFITLIIAHNLAMEGDTMEMMRAVLDTNFWLATHVVVVTLGYASTYVAGFLSVIYVLRGVFTKTLDETTTKSLARMVYGIICFATLFSFVGTVLGGIWADQSWGRFWGWDPKENGALIIVLWNAMILHLRWGGVVRERGLMLLAIGGNIVTAWSWFGVNMLQIGLHSYGFTDTAFKWLLTFVLSQVLLILFGLLPLRLWRSSKPSLV
jgi:ABC-type transport system involved in cytochrome c biogenesis permease subunit